MSLLHAPVIFFLSFLCCIVIRGCSCIIQGGKKLVASYTWLWGFIREWDFFSEPVFAFQPEVGFYRQIQMWRVETEVQNIHLRVYKIPYFSDYKSHPQF